MNNYTYLHQYSKDICEQLNSHFINTGLIILISYAVFLVLRALFLNEVFDSIFKKVLPIEKKLDIINWIEQRFTIVKYFYILMIVIFNY